MSFATSDTICAIATRTGGAIAVIRISGQEAIAMTDKVFRSASGKPLSEARQNTIHYGSVYAYGAGSSLPAPGVIDDVVVSLWRAPHSYTGEDCVEISCHGSAYIARSIVQALIKAGCRQAGHGEFTKRAYLNGKMDLSQAEAVADLISADNKASHDLAISQLKGHFSSELSRLREQLLKLTSLLELELDFSDHEDLEFADRGELRGLTERIYDRITYLAKSFETGQALKNGIPVAIIGKTNVGKSTLLNNLLNEDKAIVSDVDGTTRDTIDGTVDINGITFRFIDTAGIRRTDDKVEKIGIDRAYQQIEKAAIILWVTDAPLTAGEVEKMEKLTAGKQVIIVRNKCDLNHNDVQASQLQLSGNEALGLKFKVQSISAKNGTNMNLLRRAVYEAADIPEINEDSIIVTNARHYEALVRARSDIRRVLDGMSSGISSDLLAEDLRLCLDDLADITGGKITTEETLGNIFEHFCIGK